MGSFYEAPNRALPRRVLAGIVDGFYILVVAGLAGVAAGASAVTFLMLFLWALYPPLATALFGRTLGMAHLGLELRTCDGREAGAGAAITRGLLRPVEWVVLPLPLLLVLITGRERRQRLGDLVAGTVVVRDEVAPPGSRPRRQRRDRGERLNGAGTELALPARGWAAVIDGAVAAVLGIAAGGIDGEDTGVIVFVALLAVGPLLGELLFAQSIGKRLMGIRVEMDDGRPLTISAALLRNALRAVDFIPLLYASGLMTMLTGGRARRQRIGDRAARTVVVPDGSRWLRSFPRGVFVALGAGIFLATGTLFLLTGPVTTPFHDAGAAVRAENRTHWVTWCEDNAVMPSVCGCVFDEVGPSRVFTWYSHENEWWSKPLPSDISGAITACYARQ